MLTTWVVSLDIPAGGGERKPRPATLALRRHRRVTEVRAVSEPSGASPEAQAAGTAASNSYSGHAKTKDEGKAELFGPRDSYSGHVIGPTRLDPWAARLKRVRATLARARAAQDWIDCEPGRKAADVARRERVSRARIAQLLLLLKLAPEILADITQPGRQGPTLGELELRMLAPLPPKEQVRKYRALLGMDAPAPGDEPPRTAAKQARHRGLAAHLAHARELQVLVQSGRFSSVRAIGKHQGLSGARVSQLLNLLDLHPDIIAAIDVLPEDAPPVNERELRTVARLPEDKQVREWKRLLKR